MRTYVRQERGTKSERDTRSEGDIRDSKSVQSDKRIQEDKPIQNIKEIVKGFIGREVTVVTRSKKTLSGKLESVSNYELLLTVDHDPVIIMKHAVDYIELVATPS